MRVTLSSEIWRCKCFTTFFPFQCILFLTLPIWNNVHSYELITFSVPPTRIEIKRGNPFFISEKTYNISCSTVGSNPQPYTRIWHRNSELPVLQTTAISHLESKIIAEFQPDSEDDDSFLICKSENPLITNSAVEDQWKINVKCESTQYFQCCQSWTILGNSNGNTVLSGFFQSNGLCALVQFAKWTFAICLMHS